MMDIFLLGLTEKENANIRNLYGDSFKIIDKTRAFEDVLSTRTDAVILNPDALTKEQKDAFAEKYGRDTRVRIILTHDVYAKEKFPPCGYYIEENLDSVESIEILDLKLTERTRLNESIERMEAAIERARNLIAPQNDMDIEDYIHYMNNRTELLELLCDRLEALRDTARREKVAYRLRLREQLIDE